MPDARSPSSATNSLCGVCRRVVDEVSTPDWHIDLVHQENRADLEESASSACGICTLLLDQLRSIEHQLSSVSSNEAFPVTCESDTSAASWQKSFEIRFSCRRIEPFEALSLSFVLEVVEGPTGLPATYTPSTSTDSPECQALIKHWLHECESSHERCNASVPEAWAPSRIFDVGRGDEGSSTIWLVTQDKTQYSKEPYATLSHCWGPVSFIRVTRSNIAEFVSEGISRKTLPKTFNDAIDIVRYLGIRYLWIDALCIVQDDLDDWLHEADLMSKVYRYCSVNIAAAGAADGKGGCYRTRDSQLVQRTEFNIQWRNGNESGPSTYYVVPEPRIWSQKLLNEPLNQRCWVVQERILSPRTLQFGRQQLFWECREKIACETYHRGLPVSLQGDTFIAIKTLELGDETSDDRWPALHISKNSGTASTLFGAMWNKFTELFRPIVRQEVTLYATKRSGAVYRDWDTVVELYSLGELTYADDKLIAIAGIAEAISRGEENFPTDGYLAGLWHSSLPSHLLWTTENVNVLRHGVWQPKAPEGTAVTLRRPGLGLL